MMRSTPRPQHLWIFLGALVVVLLTRLPAMPDFLYSFDSVNLALALDDFDPSRNQPQPPGYPFFVGEARLLHLALQDPWAVFTALKILISALTVGVVFLLGREIKSTATGIAAAGLLLFAPTFWYAGLTSSLRLHLALLSAIVGLLCWRAVSSEAAAGRKWFYLAALALGIGGGFRPVLEVVLFPLVVWAGWRVGGWRTLARGMVLLALPTLVWVGVLVMAMGGPAQVASEFLQYLNEQTHQTALVAQAPEMSWRRMAVRAVLWTFIGAVAWLWALPLVWRERKSWRSWPLFSRFALIWFIPPFLFNLVVHTADPDHTLKTLPILCLTGALCLTTVESRVPAHWSELLLDHGLVLWLTFLIAVPILLMTAEMQGRAETVWGALAAGLLLVLPRLNRSSTGVGGGEAAVESDSLARLRSPVLFAALVLNILIFFGNFPLPQRSAESVSRFRGLQSLTDAVLIGTYETSFRRVDWIDVMTEFAIKDITAMKARGDRELMVVWTRDGAPVWRKVAYYFPDLKIVALEESGDPASVETRARVWVGNNVAQLIRGAAPIRVEAPPGGRLIWLLAGGREEELGRHIPIRKATNVYYTDLPESGANYRWGPFEFAAPPVAASRTKGAGGSGISEDVAAPAAQAWLQPGAPTPARQ